MLLGAIALLLAGGLAGLAGSAAGSDVDGPFYVNIVRATNDGCSDDDADLRVRIYQDDRVIGTSGEATNQNFAHYGDLVRLDAFTDTTKIGVQVQEGESAFLGGQWYVTCDAQEGDGLWHNRTYDPHAINGPTEGWGVYGDGPRAVSAQITVGPDPPTPPQVQVTAIKPTAATISWDADPEGRATGHTLRWGNYGEYIADFPGAGPGTHQLTGLKDNVDYSVRVLRGASVWTVASDDVTFHTTNVAPQQPWIARSWDNGDGTATVEWNSRTTHDIDHYEVHMSVTDGFTPTDSTLRARITPVGTFPDQIADRVQLRDGDAYVVVRAVDTGGLYADSGHANLGWDYSTGQYRPPPWQPDQPRTDVPPGPVGPHDPRGRIEAEGYNGYSHQCDGAADADIYAFSDPEASNGAMLAVPHDGCQVFYDLAQVGEDAIIESYALRVAGTDDPVDLIVMVDVDGRRIFQDGFTASYSDGIIQRPVAWSNTIPAGAREMMVTYIVETGPAYADLELDYLQGAPAPPCCSSGGSTPPPPPPADDPPAPYPNPIHPWGRIEGEWHDPGTSTCGRSGHSVEAERAADGRALVRIPHLSCSAAFHLSEAPDRTRVERYVARVSNMEGPATITVWVEADGRRVAEDLISVDPGNSFIERTFDDAQAYSPYTTELRVGFDLMSGGTVEHLELDWIEAGPAPAEPYDPPPRPSQAEIEAAWAVDGELHVEWSVSPYDDEGATVEVHVSDHRWFAAGPDTLRAREPVVAGHAVVDARPSDRYAALVVTDANGWRTQTGPAEIVWTDPAPFARIVEARARGDRMDVQWRLEERGVGRLTTEVHAGPDADLVPSPYTMRALVADDTEATDVRIEHDDRYVVLVVRDELGRWTRSEAAAIDRGAFALILRVASHDGDRLHLEIEGDVSADDDVLVRAGATITEAIDTTHRAIRQVQHTADGLVVEVDAHHDDRYVVIEVRSSGDVGRIGPLPLELVGSVENATTPTDDAPRDDDIEPFSQERPEAEARAGTESSDGDLSAEVLIKVFGGSAGLGGIVAGVMALFRRH